MTTIVVPLAARSEYFPASQYPYPVPLLEVSELPMIQYAIENLRRIDPAARFVFVTLKEDCRRFHLDRSLQLLAEGATVVALENATQGALCSCLMAIDHIDPDEPLVIANGDQFIDIDMPGLLPGFYQEGADAACLVFRSVLPRWSFVRLDGRQVVEAAEKTPISPHAIAGFYYFRKGSFFIDAARRSILQRASQDGRYYVAPALNQLIIDGRKVLARAVPNEAYFSFFTPHRIEEFETHHSARIVPLIVNTGTP